MVMVSKKAARTAAASRKGSTPSTDEAAPSSQSFSFAFGLARELKSLADKALSLAEGAVEISTAAAKTMTSDPSKKASIAKSGEFLRAAREAAGITTEELGLAIDLADPSIIDKAEKGAAVALPFDTILRIAGVLGRNDPLAFAINVARSHNPDLWKSLDQFGFGKLVAQAGREREFANLYRANDAARRLSDKEFAEVLRFVGAAFDMAVEFHAQAKTGQIPQS